MENLSSSCIMRAKAAYKTKHGYDPEWLDLNIAYQASDHYVYFCKEKETERRIEKTIKKRNFFKHATYFAVLLLVVAVVLLFVSFAVASDTALLAALIGVCLGMPLLCITTTCGLFLQNRLSFEFTRVRLDAPDDESRLFKFVAYRTV